MLFYLIVLAICQVGLLVFYSIDSSKPTEGKFKVFIPTTRHLAVVNVLAAIAIFSINRLGQFFCVPVEWASIVLILLALSMAISPLIEGKNKDNYFISFIHGIGLLICIYCIGFYRLEVLGCLILALIFSALIFLPSYLITESILRLLKINKLKSVQIISMPALFTTIVVGLPIFWLMQIIKRFIEANKIHKAITVTSCVLMLILTSFFVKAYSNIVENKEAILKVDTKVISEIKSDFFGNYMLEKAIGWALVYHTETCIYDGWRPPMHDPFLVVSNWFLKIGEPLDSDFDVKVKLYKALYPDVPIKRKCSCGIEESNTYFSDTRF